MTFISNKKPKFCEPCKFTHPHYIEGFEAIQKSMNADFNRSGSELFKQQIMHLTLENFSNPHKLVAQVLRCSWPLNLNRLVQRLPKVLLIRGKTREPHLISMIKVLRSTGTCDRFPGFTWRKKILFMFSTAQVQCRLCT